MATKAVHERVRVYNPLEQSIRTANAIISQRVVGDYIEHRNLERLTNDVAAALNCARLRRERTATIRSTLIAKNAATEICLQRQKLGFPAFVEQAILRALFQCQDD